MRRDLPPLNPLRAFECVARHLSFSRAALELHVTQPALSHQVRVLEGALGRPLFVRANRRLELTGEGERLLPAVRDALDRIAAAWESVRPGAARPRLSVRLPLHLSAKWVTPRLGHFMQRHSEVELTLNHAFHPGDTVAADADLRVTWEPCERADVECVPLLALRRVPVCSPRLLERSRLRVPADLARFTLLHEFGYEDWRRWLELMDVQGVDPARGLVVDNYGVLLEAAIDGHGVALLLQPMFGDQLERGSLVMPFGDALGIDFIYYLESSRRALERAEVRAFRDWLLEEASAFAPAPALA